jgi:hypothetical protein
VAFEEMLPYGPEGWKMCPARHLGGILDRHPPGPPVLNIACRTEAPPGAELTCMTSSPPAR